MLSQTLREVFATQTSNIPWYRMVTPAMAAGVTDKLWEMEDLVAMLEQWELANFKPEYQFVVRQYAIGKGHSVSVLWRGGEVDSVFGFDSEHEALEWIREKSRAWLIENR